MSEAVSPADPHAFLMAPNPSAVQAAQLMLSRIESDLCSKLASLPRSPDQSKEEAKLREEFENAKLPYKSIVSLFELHQIYEGLMNNTDERTCKMLEVLNSFTERSCVEPKPGQDVANAMLLDTAVHTESTKMDLTGHLLHTLPSSFGCKFANLISLDLSRNQLRDLPSAIGDLEKLEILDLQSNQLSSLPDAIGLLRNLRVLNVLGNMLVALPESLGGCRKLVELNAGFNQLEHISAGIGYNLCCLENLCLHSNKLTYIPPSLCELKRLKVLDLHFNNIKAIPSSLGNMSSLEKLNISNNFSDFGGALPESIGDMVFLVELDVSFNQIRVLPDAIGALENLKVLKVDNNPLVIPPLDVVEHSMEALLEYMYVRWNTSQTMGQEEMCASPRSLSLKVGFRTPFTGTSLVHWLYGRCVGRNAVSLALHHKQLKSI